MSRGVLSCHREGSEHFPAMLRLLDACHMIADHCRYLPKKYSSVSMQSATPGEKFLYSIDFHSCFGHISHDGLLNAHHLAENRLRVRYSNIGSKITSTLENTLQSITCKFAALQEHWNVPSWMYNNAPYGRGFRCVYRTMFSS